MLNRRVLEGRVGDRALPWWREVWRWASSLPVVVGPDMTVTQVPGMGTEIRIKTASPPRVPYEVGVTGRRAFFRPGLLAGESPWVLHQGKAWMRLDGRGLDGSISTTAPEMDLTAAKPGADGRSCLALVAKVDERGDLLDPTEDPTALRIEHRDDLGPQAKRLAEEAGEPFHELAILYWRDEHILRTTQIVQHHLELARGPAGNSGGLRYFFIPAG